MCSGFSTCAYIKRTSPAAFLHHLLSIKPDLTIPTGIQPLPAFLEKSSKFLQGRSPSSASEGQRTDSWGPTVPLQLAKSTWQKPGQSPYRVLKGCVSDRMVFLSLLLWKQILWLKRTGSMLDFPFGQVVFLWNRCCLLAVTACLGLGKGLNYVSKALRLWIKTCSANASH